MKKRNIFKIMEAMVLCIVMVFTMTISAGCGNGDTAKSKDVTILFVNDSHTFINNVNKGNDGKETPGLSYASVADMKKNLEKEGKNVILADCGDFIQGTSYGAIDQGVSMSNVLNSVGIDISTIGNHEFDYGTDHLERIISRFNFPCVSCNWVNPMTGRHYLDGYKVINVGGCKVAFVGMTTPEASTTTSPNNLVDSNGNKISDFLEGNSGFSFYEEVQKNIDEAKEEADYVIGLGHLGVDQVDAPYRSSDVIQNTAGFDAFIDGHSHTVMEGENFKDKNGKDVLVTQTGSYLKAIGQMEIQGGKISSKLITNYSGTDEVTSNFQELLRTKVNDKFGEKIGSSEDTFYINEPSTSQRIVRNRETNLGNLTADAIYYAFNEKYKQNCDVVFNNGGNCRKQIEPGDWTMQTCKDVMPFGNMICLIKASGQQILDALEWGVNSTGKKDGNGNPIEFGGFPQIAGVKFDVNSSIPSTVQKDEKGRNWVGKPTGEYRVSNVQIYNKETKEYEDLVLNKEYNVGGCNFTLRSGGDGYTMFKDCDIVTDYVAEEYVAFSDYIKAFENSKIKTQNSPLKKYTNYLMDYENPYGAGRVNIK